MEGNEYIGFTPDYIDALLPRQIFVFGSNALGYHTGGASGTARKKFGAVWGQPEGLQGQSYARDCCLIFNMGQHEALPLTRSGSSLAFIAFSSWIASTFVYFLPLWVTVDREFSAEDSTF
jgi:hypothetical protein